MGLSPWSATWPKCSRRGLELSRLPEIPPPFSENLSPLHKGWVLTGPDFLLGHSDLTKGGHLTSTGQIVFLLLYFSWETLRLQDTEEMTPKVHKLAAGYLRLPQFPPFLRPTVSVQRLEFCGTPCVHFLGQPSSTTTSWGASSERNLYCHSSEVQKSETRYCQGWCLLEALREKPSPASPCFWWLPVSLGAPWHAGVSLRWLPPSWHRLLLCASVSSPLPIMTLAIGFRAHPKSRGISSQDF